MAFSKTLVYTRFGSSLNRGFNKTNVLLPNHLLHKELFYTKTVLSTNTMFYTKTMFLLGLQQWLFAAYRIALSMVAGGTRRRRLNLPLAGMYMHGI